MPLSTVDDYAETVLAPQLSQLPGVAQVLVYGAQKFAVRVQVNPTEAAARNIALEDVRSVVAKANSSTPVGVLTGLTWRGRIAFILLAFGVWDVAYYLFLIPLTAWPSSILDWDILFLIPLPWWGPVLAPVSLACLMITFGILATVLEQAEPGVEAIHLRRIAALPCLG